MAERLSATRRHWYDPAPVTYPYPWKNLSLPWIPTEQEALVAAEEMKRRGNQSFKNGDYYDSLWKYEHANALLDSFVYLKVNEDMATLNSNISASCMKLGDEDRTELLHSVEGFPIHQIMWYGYSHQHAHTAISLDPNVKIAYKAYRRRGESFKKMLSFPGMQDAMKMFMPDDANPYSTIIMDYITSCELQEVPDPRTYYEAIVMAVDEDQTEFLPPFTDSHVKIGLPSKILKEVFNDPASTPEHIDFLLFDMEICSSIRPYYDASSLSPSNLLRRNIFAHRLYEKLAEYGMPISSDDVNLAVNLLPGNKLKLFKLLVSRCLSEMNHEEDSLQKACDSATRLSKRAFLDALKDYSKSSYTKLKDEGNAMFVQGDYEQALGKYFQALKYCREHKMNKEMSLIRANCAQACLRLELFSDAYTHCCECLKLDKTNHKGYYRRAEALKALMQSSSEYGSCVDVVKDYLKCHEIQTCLEAFCQAVVLAVKHGCTHLIPKLRTSDVRSGFSNEFFKHITTKCSLTDKLLQFVVLKLPESQIRVQPYHASSLDLKSVLQKCTDGPVIKKMLEWGVWVSDSDVMVATRCLRDTQADVYELVLSRLSHREGFLHTCINQACNEAIQTRKPNFVVALIKRGSNPPPDLLLSMDGVCNNQHVQDYLEGVRSAMLQRQYDNDCGIPSEDVAFHKDCVSDMSLRAKKSFKSGEHKAAVKYYHEALKVCQDFGFRDEASSIHNNLAHLHLRCKRYDMAYKHSTESIRLASSQNSKGYFRRAEASKYALRTRCPVRGGTSYGNAIEDYRKSYELKPDVKTLLEAILLANEIGKLGLLLLECKTLSEKSCQELLQLLLPKLSCKTALLTFLMLQAWESKKFDCSAISLETLLTEKKITNPNLLLRFLELGAAVQNRDITSAILNLSPDDIGVFKVIVSKCDGFDKNAVCCEAANANKTLFVLHLVELGANLPEDSGTRLFKEALRVKEFEGAKLLINCFSKETLESLDLAVLLESTYNLILNVELIEKLIVAGVCITGKKSPVPAVMSSSVMGCSEKIDVLCSLIEHGVDCKQLCQMGHKSTTPLHVATDLALQSDGNVKLIEAVVASPSFDKTAKLVNEKGETPLHLASKPHLKKAVSCAVLTCLLETNLMDPSIKDKSNKRPRDHIPTKDSEDPRIKVLEAATSKFNPEKKKNKKKKKKKNDSEKKKDTPAPKAKKPVPQIEEEPANSPEPPPENPPEVVKTLVKKYEDMTTVDKIVYHLNRLRKEDDVYFQTDIQDSSFQEPVANNPGTLQLKRMTPTLLSPSRHPVLSPDRASMANVSPSQCSDITVVSEGSSELELDGLNFDNLPWEVEVTRNVVKFFRNTKKYSPTDRVSAARVIYSIAEGKRNKHLSKQVGSNQNVNLYEARITSSGRILWDKAINFSAKLTGNTSTPMYTEVIRVWEVILDHDDLDRKIEFCSEQIVQSYERGYLSAVRYPLKPMLGPGAGSVRGQQVLDMPCIFTTQTLPNAEHHFIPAASTNESEYNVTTFYSFDTVTVKSMIAGSNEKRDYPFKEWQKEHEIIKLSSKEAILLLGRSGTGKTTCCLYRLWNEFKNYWNPNSEIFGVKLPRKTLISSSSLGHSDDDTLSVSEEESGSEDEVDEVFEVSSDPSMSMSGKSKAISSDSSGPGVFVGKDQVTELVEEDLHQVFVTKNYVLCDQMKKRFYCMAAAHDFLEPHLPFEEEPLPNSFEKFENLSFPAFLTARQFYILLDNSLGGPDTFFKRDASGNLQVKITSLDYDHEDADILLDLEQSDSEDEDVERVYPSTATQNPAPRQHSSRWTEVTALYFKEIVWPKISQQYAKEFDPMLVWLEIQSFIKGSELAIRKGAPLSFLEYKCVGNRMAPNFSNHREAIYKLFRKYERFVQNCRHSDYLFDECDLVIDLHQRLKNTVDVPWSIHSVYIDEVQDFTQAELAIFIHCCRDPNSMFFTGDTAQSIMRGIAFRFQDLRSCFHRINQKVPCINVPRDPLKLTINYRSHSGILKLAGSVIDLISEFFKDSIDHLPDDEGMFPGPMPIFLDSCEVKDLSLLLSTNKRECSAIEFGAHQVILVQSKEAKDRLPDILKGAIVLTIFEAKGLEFDDVLLYNFFTDSLVSEKGWRVITSYLEMPGNKEKIKNKKKLLLEPRSKPFDPTLHKSLNAELKYLYTAITRAKCNLWIYDSNEKNRLPMLDYWHKRKAVKIVMSDGAIGQDYNLVFASNSTPEQWSSQGDNFRKKHLWEQAILCYEKAGVEYAYLVKEAYAYHYIQEARQQKPQIFLNAALSFFERDELIHSVHCLNGAALCLKNSRPPKHIKPAATLFERLGDLAKAAQCFLKGRDFDNFARIQESQGEYDSVIKSLQGKPFMRKRDALAKADEYEKKGYKLDPKFTPSELSFSCAKFYSERNDTKILLEVLKYMPEQEKRVKFMKEASLYNEAFEEHVNSKQFSDAYRLALAQGWFDKGIGLARKAVDEVTEGKFVIQQAKEQYLKANKDDDLIAKLKKVTTSKEKLLQAEANLLLGMLLKSSGPCITALGHFKLLKHKAGILESFNQIMQHGKVSNQEVLDCCHIAKNVSATLTRSSDMNIDVKQAVKLCGLQLVGRVYITSKFGNVWITQDTLARFQCEDAMHDIDEMMRLRSELREDAIAGKYKAFIHEWLTHCGIEARLQQSLSKFLLHTQLFNHRRLNRLYSPHEVSSISMREYLQVCVHLLELFVLKDKSASMESVVAHILAIFSPQVHIYLPQCMNDKHLQTVRRSENSRKAFISYIEARQPEGEHEKIDKWLSIWRAGCVALPSMKYLLEKMNALESKVNDDAKVSKEGTKTDKDGDKSAVEGTKDAAKTAKEEVKPNEEAPKKFVKPPGYIYWRNDNRYCHIFSLWLSSCSDLREKSRALWAAKLAITHFLGNIAEDKQVSISVMSCVYILTIHCTSLLAMITHANSLQGYSTTFTVPLMYKHMVQLFSHMNCRQGTSDKSLLAACVEQVSSWRNLNELFRECKQLLIRAMGYLIGMHSRAQGFSMLKFGLQGNFSDSDATRLCLIFTLTLYGNLIMLKVRDLKVFGDKIWYILKKTISRNDRVPFYVRKVYEQACNSPNFSRPAFVFNLVADLLTNSKMDSTMSKLILKQGHIEFSHYQPQHTVPQVAKPSSAVLPPSRAAEKLPPVPATSVSELPRPSLSSTELGTMSPPTAPIGSERRQTSGLPSSTTACSPQQQPDTSPSSGYLPGLPMDRSSSVPSVVGSHFPASADGYSPMGHDSDVPFTATPAGQSSDPLGIVGSSEQVISSLPPPSSSDPITLTGLEASSGSTLTPFAPEFVPTASFMEMTPAELAPALNQPLDPSLLFIPTYNFQDDLFAYYPGQQDQQEETGLPFFESNYGESYGLTQQLQPLFSIPVDPELIGEDIIDEPNCFCMVCGVDYVMDNMIEDYNDGSNIEGYYAHVTGTSHHRNTVAFKRFKLTMGELTEVESDNFKLIEFAEMKLKECKDMQTRIESEPLDQLTDTLQDHVNKYHLTVSEYEDSRKWEEGVMAVTSMNERISSLLININNQLHKLAESRQRELQRNIQDDEDEMDEIEKYSASYDEKTPNHGSGRSGRQGDRKMRTEKEKVQSRDKKRSKKRSSRDH